MCVIRRLIANEKVTYYAIVLIDDEGNEFDLFEDFVQRNEAESAEQLNVMRSWLQRIGSEYGAQSRWFRFENSADALPPSRRYLEIEMNLRRYCMRIDNKNVILFSEGLKTAQAAQDCANVGTHFHMANKLARCIDQAMIEQQVWGITRVASNVRRIS